MADSAYFRERSKRMYELNVEKKVTQRKIAEMYGVSYGRVYQLIKEEKAKRKAEKDICLRDRIINKFEYLDNDTIDSQGRRSTASISSTIYNVFRYLLYFYKDESPETFFKAFLELTYDELIDIRNMGVKKTALVQRIQDIIKSDYNYYNYILLNDCKKVTPYK